MPSTTHVLKGLEGVYVLESSISMIDTEQGALYYAGYDVRDLVERSNFEETIFILLNQRLPTRKEYLEFTSLLRESLELQPLHIETIKHYVSRTDILSLLSLLMVLEGGGKKGGDPAEKRSGIDAVAKMASFYSAILRIRSGGEYVPPRGDLNFAENMLYMIDGEVRNADFARVLDDLLIIHAEHGIPASTFASLVAASTLSDLYSSIAAGILALKGPLHGGAAEASYAQAMEIGNPERVRAWLESALSEKRKIMGFGHRVYKMYDPRATIVKKIITGIENYMDSDVKRLYEITVALDAYGQEYLAPRGIYPNLDLWTPILYRTIGLPPDSFTALFAVSRSAGWASHILEYWMDNKLIRPLHLYKGQYPKKYIPLELR
ncbi:MAG: citrate/2-methylcitrate synthase [Nitrososphaerota archaeon]